MFSLDDGSYSFLSLDDPVAPDLILDLPMREIIRDGVRSITDLVALRIGVGSMTDYLHLGLELEVEPASLNASEAFVLSCVDGRTMMVDLLSISSMDELETLQSIAALLAVGMVEARPEPLPVPSTLAPETEAETDAARTEPNPDLRPDSPMEPAAQPQAPDAAPELTAKQKRQVAAKSYLEARRLFNENHYHEAIRALEEVICNDPAQAPYHRLLGRACATQPQIEVGRSGTFPKKPSSSTLSTPALIGIWVSCTKPWEKSGDAKNMFRQVLELDRKHQGARKKLASGGFFSRLRSLLGRNR